MLQTATRRKRRLAKTASLGLSFLVVASVGVLVLSRPEPEYQPGEPVEGLTAALARSLPDDYPRVLFEDVTKTAGIAFHHFQGTRSTQLPEDMGSGAAWGDYDNDGWLDLYVVNEAGALSGSRDEIRRSAAHSHLYHNNGDGTFRETSVAAGVAHRGMGMAAAWGDYDNDGWADLFVSAYGENTLYHNNGNGTFTDVSDAAGIAGYQGFWTGVSWSDYNRDGLLDVYVTGYVKYVVQQEGLTLPQYDVEVPASLNPSSFAPERNLLYHNNGNGTFTEVARRAGVAGEMGRSLSAAWSDLDDDGWPDLYVANDVSDNVLYRNLGDGTFEDASHAAWVADYRGAMGIAVGDWDGDQDADMFITHWIAQENALYSSLGADVASMDSMSHTGMRFMDEADRFGLGQIALDYIGWGTSFFDYDNDGKLDLFVANGSTFQKKDDRSQLIPMRDQLFWNRSARDGFYDVSLVSGAYFHREYVGRGAAFGDYDNDGDIDIFVVNNGGPGVLLRNENTNGNHWIEVRLTGRRSNRSAIGTKVRVVVGDLVQIQELGAQSSYLSQNSPVAHFGLGPHVLVDTLEIVWPSGARQTVLGVAANRLVEVSEDAPR